MSSLFPIPASAMLKLKKLPRGEAAKLLAAFTLDADTRARLLDLSLPDVTSEPPSTTRVLVYDPKRRVFIAAAWIAGASWNQLGALFGIARQSVQQQADRVFPAHLRALLDAKRMKLSYERLERMRDIFMAAPDQFGSDPEKVAELLREATEDVE
jgi:hypothetical protein